MKEQKSPWLRHSKLAVVTAACVGLIATPTQALADTGEDEWRADVTSVETGVTRGYQLEYSNGKVYVADPQWRSETGSFGTPENTPFEKDDQRSMRTTFSPYGVEVDPDVNGETVLVTTTARQTAAEATDGKYQYGGGVVVYSASQGAPTDADRVFRYNDGSPVFSGPRRIAVDKQRNLAYVTNLGSSRSSAKENRDGYITVLDLTKRGTAAVIAQVTVPDAAGAIGVSVDEANNLIYVGGFKDAGDTGIDTEKLYVIDGSKLVKNRPTDFTANNGAIRALDAVVGGNARPFYDAATKKVYVSAYDASTITVVNADPANAAEYGKAVKSIKVEGTAPDPSKPRLQLGTNEVTVDAARGLLYSANLDAGITVYDINDDYAQLEFTAQDGTKTREIRGSGRTVNVVLNPANGEVWGSTIGNTGKLDIFKVTGGDATATPAPTPTPTPTPTPQPPAQDEETITFTTNGTAPGTVTLPKNWVAGKPLTVKGTGFTANKAGNGARIAVKVNTGGVSAKPEPANSEGISDLWAVIDADENGNFTAEFPFPTPDNSNVTATPEPGTQYDFAFLTGSLGVGTDRESSIRGGRTPKVTVVAAEAAQPAPSQPAAPAQPQAPAQPADPAATSNKVWQAAVESFDTGVQNGYQLALDGTSAYVADAKWTTGKDLGTGKLVQVNIADRKIVKNHDFTQLRRNDGKFVASEVTTEADGKLVVIDAKTKKVEGKLSYLDLTRNDGTGKKENEPFAWSDFEAATSKSGVRSSFSPYGVAVDPDVNGSPVAVTTNARQNASVASGGKYTHGGGIVVFNPNKGNPTDADRVFEYEDGTPVFAGPRRVDIDDARNLAYVTSLGARGGAGYVTVLDLTKRGIDSVVAQVPLPNGARTVGTAVDSENNRIYVGSLVESGKLYVIDGNKIKRDAPKDFTVNAGAVSELEAVVGSNSRPTYNAADKRLYVSSFADATITVVNADPADANYGKEVKKISVESTADGQRAQKSTNSVAIDNERGLLFSANLDAGVTVYNIKDDYKPVTFTAADGSKYTEIKTGGRAVNFGINPETGEVWVSNWGDSGKVDVINITKRTAKPAEPSDITPPANSDELTKLADGGLIGEQDGNTVTIKNIPVADYGWVHIYGYSTPSYTGAFEVVGGQTKVDVSGFSVGKHFLAVYNTDGKFLGYVPFVIQEKPAAPGTGNTGTPGATGNTGDTGKAPGAAGAGTGTTSGKGGSTLARTGAGDLTLPLALGVVALLAGAVTTVAARRKRHC